MAPPQPFSGWRATLASAGKPSGLPGAGFVLRTAAAIHGVEQQFDLVKEKFRDGCDGVGPVGKKTAQPLWNRNHPLPLRWRPTARSRSSGPTTISAPVKWRRCHDAGHGAPLPGRRDAAALCGIMGLINSQRPVESGRLTPSIATISAGTQLGAASVWSSQ